MTTYNYVTVTFKYLTGEGLPQAGRYGWYTSPGSVEDTTLHQNLDVTPVFAQLDATGLMSVSLLATDNAHLSAFTWVYVPLIQGEEAVETAYFVPFAGGASQTLDNLVPAPV